MKKAEALALAKSANPDVASVASVSSIASLWGGMGSIDRIRCNTAAGDDGDSGTITIIAKRIRCTNPRSFGDRRKAASYVVECAFYTNHANELGNICCRGLHCEDDGSGNITILMTPLPNPTLHYMDAETTGRAAVRSVARLHAHYWGNERSVQAVREGGLAEQGSYWYLDTRPDELDAMSSRGLEGRLKNAAHDIDEALKDHPYQTIIHGDLKACNMSVSEDERYVTLVDFQYCGRACPAKDLAYLFVCGMDVESDFEERQEEDLLRLYVGELAAHGTMQSDELPTLKGLTGALDLAYCDLYRWMCGWGVWGNGFLHGRVDRCLDNV